MAQQGTLGFGGAISDDFVERVFRTCSLPLSATTGTCVGLASDVVERLRVERLRFVEAVERLGTEDAVRTTVLPT